MRNLRQADKTNNLHQVSGVSGCVKRRVQSFLKGIDDIFYQAT